MMVAELVLPTFLYIGAAKSGSTWIFEALREHPEVFVPVAKDLQYFDANYHRGMPWYASHFRPGRSAKARGELSHNYFTNQLFAERIRGDLAAVKLLCCLREPVDRTMSAFSHALALGTATRNGFQEFCNRPSVVRAASYYRNLVPFFEEFPREDILVLFYDELVRDARQFFRSILCHIEVDPDFTPTCIDQRVLARRAARYAPLGKVANRVSVVLRRYGLANLVGRIKRSPAVEAVLYSPASQHPAISESTRAELRQRYGNTHDELEALVGRRLPESWRRTSTDSSLSR